MRSLVSLSALLLAMAVAFSTPASAEIKAYGTDDPNIPNCTLTLHTDCENVVVFNTDGVTSAGPKPAPVTPH